MKDEECRQLKDITSFHFKKEHKHLLIHITHSIFFSNSLSRQMYWWPNLYWASYMTSSVSSLFRVVVITQIISTEFINQSRSKKKGTEGTIIQIRMIGDILKENIIDQYRIESEIRINKTYNCYEDRPRSYDRKRDHYFEEREYIEIKVPHCYKDKSYDRRKLYTTHIINLKNNNDCYKSKSIHILEERFETESSRRNRKSKAKEKFLTINSEWSEECIGFTMMSFFDFRNDTRNKSGERRKNVQLHDYILNMIHDDNKKNSLWTCLLNDICIVEYSLIASLILLNGASKISPLG
ncbi:hypothetical protein AGLY_001895 [Aphis glycines]|uniref:Uncharacterized protein n=1 Tax=Aphis glycines TaxID=307491 RepID=A0A6G0U4N2_APHGL|nr:hypothetical protein AGLY_001895 [Aphis glycines]